ncbi:ATP-binding protein [Streptomyces cacaoi]|uniref:ATP-binding protein n=1 Tax=Streptomyces cacaoi TaxID=1898 RepID=UPI00332ADF05
MDQVMALRDNGRPPLVTTRTQGLHSSGQARRITRAFLSSLSPPPPAESAESVLLVVSELVTNALRHAQGVTEFRLGAAHGTVTVEVADPSSALPAERAPGSLDEAEQGGFGWPIVRHLASDITIRLRHGQGKIIHAGIALLDPAV